MTPLGFAYAERRGEHMDCSNRNLISPSDSATAVIEVCFTLLHIRNPAKIIGVNLQVKGAGNESSHAGTQWRRQDDLYGPLYLELVRGIGDFSLKVQSDHGHLLDMGRSITAGTYPSLTDRRSVYDFNLCYKCTVAFHFNGWIIGEVPCFLAVPGRRLGSCSVI